MAWILVGIAVCYFYVFCLMVCAKRGDRENTQGADRASATFHRPPEVQSIYPVKGYPSPIGEVRARAPRV